VGSTWSPLEINGRAPCRQAGARNPPEYFAGSTFTLNVPAGMDPNPAGSETSVFTPLY
jgi:hypothetical protein